jgi:predicted TIM-barrel fold metal-dependent hydrolase
MSEGGIGWVPGVIDRIENLRDRDVVSDGSVDAELFRRNFWFCALNEPSGFRSVDVIGIDNILIESDYPHSDSTWPDTQSLFKRHLADLSVEDQRKICWQNATRLFRHKPPQSPLP